MCSGQHVQTESEFTLQPTKFLVFTTAKKCKDCSHVPSIPSEDQKPIVTLFGGDGTHGFQKGRVATVKKEIHLHF